MIEEETKLSLPFEEEEEEEEGHEETSLFEQLEGVEALPGLSIKLSNSAFSIEVHLAGIVPGKGKMEEFRGFLQDLLAIAKDYHLIE